MKKFDIGFGVKLNTDTVYQEIDKINEKVKQKPIKISIELSSSDRQYLEALAVMVTNNNLLEKSINGVTIAQREQADQIKQQKNEIEDYNHKVRKSILILDDFLVANKNMIDQDTVNSVRDLKTQISSLTNTEDVEKLKRLNQQFDELKRSFNTGKKNVLIDERTGNELQRLIRDMKKLGETKDLAFQRNPELLNELDALKNKTAKLTDEFRETGTVGKSSMGEVSVELRNLKSRIQATQEQTMSFSEHLQEAMGKFGLWSGVTAMYYKGVQGIKMMITNVIELDTALTELNKVADLSEDQLKSFTDRAYEAGVEVGRTGREIIDAMTIFAQAGYEANTAFDLGKVATMMVNVGDGIENVEQASKVLISTMKGFGMTADDSVRIVDTLNKVSNTSAISFSDLADGMARTSAVMNQAGVSIEETTGLLTGSNEILQNIEKSSSGLVTISQRLRGIKEAGDESAPAVAKLGQAYKDIGIDIIDANGELRSTYDILSDLSKIYPELSSTQKQYIGELSAGKHQVAVLQSLMQNWDSVAEATENAKNSAGASAKEQEAYLNSIEGKVSQLKSAFEQLSVNTINSDMIKFFVDMTTGIVKVVDSLGILNIAMVAFIAMLNKKQDGMIFDQMVKRIPVVGQKMQDMVSGYNDIISKNAILQKEIKETGVNSVNSMTSAQLATQSFGASVKSLGIQLGMISAYMVAFNVAMMAVSAVKDWVFRDEIKEAGIELQESTDKLKEMQSEYDSLTEKARSGDLTSAEEVRLDLLTKQLQAQRDINEAKKAEVIKKAGVGENDSGYDLDPTDLEAFAKGISEVDSRYRGLEEVSKSANRAIGDTNGTAKTSTETFQKMAFASEYLRQRQKELSDELGRLTEAGEENSRAGKNAQRKLDETNASIENLKSSNQDLLDSLFALGLGYEDFNQKIIDAQYTISDNTVATDGLIESTVTVEDAVRSLGDAGSEIDSIYKDLKDSTQLLSQAMSEMDSSGQLSLDTMMSLISSGYDLASMVEYENGVWQLNGDAVGQAFEIKKQSAILELQQRKMVLDAIIGYMEAEVEAQATAGDSAVDSASRQAQAIDGLQEMVALNSMSIIQSLGGTAKAGAEYASAQAKSIMSSLGSLTDSNKGQWLSTLEGLKDQSSQYQKSIDVLSSMSLPDFTRAQKGATRATKGNTGATKGNTRATKENSKALEENKQRQKELQQQIDKTKDAIKEENDAFAQKKKAYELFIKEVTKILEKELKLLDKQKEATAKRYDDEIDAIRYKLELLDDTADAEDKIKKLQEAQLDILKKRQLLEDIRKNRNVKVYREGEGWTYDIDRSAEKQAKEDVLSAEQSFTDLAHAWDLEQQKLNLEAHIKQIEKSKDDAIALIDLQIEKLQELKDEWSKALDIQEDLSKYAGMLEALADFENGSYEFRKDMLGSFTASWQYEYKKHEDSVTSLEAELKNLEAQLKASKEQADGLTASANGARDAIGGAQGALDKFNATRMEDKKAKIEYEEKVPSHLEYLGKSPNHGDEYYNKRNGQTISQYAHGGVSDVTTGQDELIDYTGYYRMANGSVESTNKWVDGSSMNPETIVSGDSAKWLHDVLTNRDVHQLDPSSVTQNTTSNSDSLVISQLNITADNGDTLKSLLREAETLAKTRKF